MAQAIRILRFGGFVSLGLVAMLLMAIFNETLPTAMRSRTQRRAWCRWIVRVVLVQGVVLCVCSDPVWEVGQVFGPAMLHLLMLLGAILVFVRYALRKGIIQGWYWTMLILGVMSGETTLGLLLAVACLFFCRLRAELNADKMQNPLADPFVRTMVMRRMTVIAAVGFVFFCMQDGLEAHDLSGFQYSVTYLHNYWKLLTTASSPSGWMLSIIVVLVPFVLSIVHLSVATDDDKFLPYWYAAYFLLVGLVAFLQLAGWQSFWFWTWTSNGNAVESSLLKCCCSFLNAQTFTYALCVLGVEVYFRNYKRIAGIQYQDSVEDTELGADLAASLRRFSRISRLTLLLEPLVMFALVVPYRMQTTTRGIIRALYDFARQTAWECQDARFVFTDGTLDTAVELCAREQGRELLPLSLTGGSTERERFLRGRGALDEEDREMMSYGAVDALRTWLRHKQQRLDDVAVQLGFELWTLAKQPQPPVAGLVARPSGFPPGLAKEGIERAHALVARVLDVYAGDDELEDVQDAGGHSGPEQANGCGVGGEPAGRRSGCAQCVVSVCAEAIGDGWTGEEFPSHAPRRDAAGHGTCGLPHGGDVRAAGPVLGSERRVGEFRDGHVLFRQPAIWPCGDLPEDRPGKEAEIAVDPQQPGRDAVAAGIS